METTQAEVMINTMEVEKFDLDEDLSLEIVDVTKPLQELFDECLNFISVNDFEIE